MTIPPHADVRDCRLYRFRVYHPDDMTLQPEQRRVVIGYIGETVRQPLARLLEHLYDQPWADTIVGWDVDPRVFAGKAAVLEAERFAVETELPLYNVEWNRANPLRIPPPVAMKQRKARDAARDVPARWVHPDDRGGVVRVPSRPTPASPKATVPKKARSPWKPWQRHLLGWSIAWAVSALGSWVWFASVAEGRVRETGILAAVWSSIVVGVLAHLVSHVRSGSKRKRKPARKPRRSR